jgi:hypothetical protein
MRIGEDTGGGGMEQAAGEAAGTRGGRSKSEGGMGCNCGHGREYSKEGVRRKKAVRVNVRTLLKLSLSPDKV